MSRKVIYRMGPIEGIAHNKTRARESAERQAIEALNRLAQGGNTFQAPPGSDILAIEIRPGLYGWGYAWTEKEHFTFRSITSGFETYQECLWAAVRHGAQNALDARSEDLNPWLDKVEAWASAVLRDASQAIVLRSELRDMWAWQVRYRDWKATGVSEVDAHNFASSNLEPPKGGIRAKEDTIPEATDGQG
jgi:hypothetical protein